MSLHVSVSSRLTASLGVALILHATPACGRVEQSTAHTDGGKDAGVGPRLSADGRCDLAKSFGVPEVVQVTGRKLNAYPPTLSTDELGMFFADAQRPGIYFTRRPATSEAFDEPTVVPSLLLEDVEDVYLTADARTIYYSVVVYGAFPSTGRSSVIRASSRSSPSADFRDDPAAAAGLNEGAYAGSQMLPYLSSDSGRIYYVTNNYLPRPGEGYRNALLRRTWTGDRWENETFQWQNACSVLSPDELTVYCGLGLMATRVSQDSLFEMETRASEALKDMHPSWVSPNGCRIYGRSGAEFVVAEKPR